MTDKQLKIGILARGLSEPIGGVKQYIYDISEALVKHDKKNKYIIFYNSEKYIRGFNTASEVVIKCRNKLFNR